MTTALIYDPDERLITDLIGRPVARLKPGTEKIDQAIGPTMAAAIEMRDALKGMLRPWDGFSEAELRRREKLGRLDHNLRPLGLHDADEIIAARAALALCKGDGR